MTDKSIREPAKSTATRKGLLTVFTGDGKGKTTAAIGTAVRAAGYGLRVLIVFFFKGKMFNHGEVLALEKFSNVKTVSFGASGWVKRGVQNTEASAQAGKALETARKALTGGEYDLVIMDEVNSAVDFGLVSLEDVIKVVSARPDGVDLILTGRHADPRIVEMADTVTEMVNVKHAFENGVMAREGIDY